MTGIFEAMYQSEFLNTCSIVGACNLYYERDQNLMEGFQYYYMAGHGK